MQSLSDIFVRIKRSQFLYSVAVLGSGTVLAQVIVIAASPALTRLYSPADFGLAALFAAIVASVTPAICGKYEVAIVVGKTVTTSRQLLGVAVNFAFGVSLIALSMIFLLDAQITLLFDTERLGAWLLLVPVMLMLTGLLAAFQYYSNRIQAYGTISRSKVLKAVVGVAVGLAMGIVGFNAGLLVSVVIATCATSGWLIYRYKALPYRTILAWSRRKKVLARRYRAFPLYSASTGLLDGLTQALPVFFLSGYFTEALVGYYALMLRVAVAPLAVISGAVSQVNLKKVSDLVHKGQKVRPYLLRMSMGLVAIVVPVGIVLVLFAAPLFAWIFGEEWRVAGGYLQILMPALALRFVVSTISTTFGATGNNRLGALWKVVAFVVTLSALVIAAPRVDASGIFLVLMLTDIFLYSLYYLLAWHAAANPRAYS